MAIQRLIIGITGASGIIYGIRLLEILKTMPIETHLVVSKAARLTLSYETELTTSSLERLAHAYHPCNDIAAPIASGSFKTMGMIIAPCSMKTLGEIASGTGATLIARAADVVLKERRRLVITPREAPLHLGHLHNMTKITEMGGIIFPPVASFYNNPKSIDDLVKDTVGRVLNLFNLDNDWVRPWTWDQS